MGDDMKNEWMLLFVMAMGFLVLLGIAILAFIAFGVYLAFKDNIFGYMILGFVSGAVLSAIFSFIMSKD